MMSCTSLESRNSHQALSQGSRGLPGALVDVDADGGRHGMEWAFDGAVGECALVVDDHGHELDAGTEVLEVRPGGDAVHGSGVVPVVHEHHAEGVLRDGVDGVFFAGNPFDFVGEGIAAELVAHLVDHGEDGVGVAGDVRVDGQDAMSPVTPSCDQWVMSPLWPPVVKMLAT